jgi:predicted esterase
MVYSAEPVPGIDTSAMGRVLPIDSQLLGDDEHLDDTGAGRILAGTDQLMAVSPEGALDVMGGQLGLGADEAARDFTNIMERGAVQVASHANTLIAKSDGSLWGMADNARLALGATEGLKDLEGGTESGRDSIEEDTRAILFAGTHATAMGGKGSANNWVTPEAGLWSMGWYPSAGMNVIQYVSAGSQQGIPVGQRPEDTAPRRLKLPGKNPARAHAGRVLFWQWVDAADSQAAVLQRQLLSERPSVQQICEWLRRGRPAQPVEDRDTPWENVSVTGIDGKERTSLLRVPDSFTSWERRHPLIVELHGGVAYPTPRPIAEMRETEYSIVGGMVDEAFYLQPRGTREALWFNEVGSDNVRRAIREVFRHYPIDPNRVYLGGFSDGGHGAYYFAVTCPDQFAGIIPLNGSPLAAQLGGDQIHLGNAANVPLYIVNTGRDQLLPPRLVEPLVELMRKSGVDLKYTLYENLPHAPLYMKREIVKITDWMDAHVRTPYPNRLVWDTPDTERWPGIYWLRVNGIGSAGNDHPIPDVNLAGSTGRVRLGIQADMNWNGKGVRIDSVVDGSLAERMGLKANDVIIDADRAAIQALEPLRRVLAGKSPGDGIQLGIEREGDSENVTMEGRFSTPKARPVFKRDRPYASVRATYGENHFKVEARQVEAFTLALSPDMVDFAEPVIVSVNGSVVFEDQVEPSVESALRWARRYADPRQIYTADLAIKVTGPGGREEPVPGAEGTALAGEAE